MHSVHSPMTAAAVDRPRNAVAADLDVVIVSYRCRDLVLRALAGLVSGAGDLAISVRVVDNGSADGTVPSIRRGFPDVEVVAVGYNSGFAAASNRGIDAGTGRYVMLLNPDAVPAPGSLDALVRFADAHPQAGVVAPWLLNADGSDQLTARSFPTPAAAVFGRRSPLTRMFPRNRWSASYLSAQIRSRTEPFRVDWVSGAAMLVRRSVIDTVGALDEDFFLFWEDADWCRRISDAGYDVWCVPAACVTHDEGGSREHGWTPRSIRWFHQGAYRYWMKHHAPSPWNPLRWAAGVLLTARAAVLTVRHGLRASAASRPPHYQEVRP